MAFLSRPDISSKTHMLRIKSVSEGHPLACHTSEFEMVPLYPPYNEGGELATGLLELIIPAMRPISYEKFCRLNQSHYQAHPVLADYLPQWPWVYQQIVHYGGNSTKLPVLRLMNVVKSVRKICQRVDNPIKRFTATEQGIRWSTEGFEDWMRIMGDVIDF
jgi:hypothetical protein